MRTLITGTTGQIGSALIGPMGALGDVIPTTRAELDLSVLASIEPTLARVNPELIVNPAAYTAVDQAEDEPELAHAVNAEGPGYIARWAASRGVPLIHFSTDYVFDGSGERPWSEQDTPRPLSIYGASKFAGEQLIRAAGGPHLIVRTSRVYAARGRNFLSTIARLADERSELRVVADQIGAPTSARIIADALVQIALAGRADLCAAFARTDGLIHLATRGETSWHGFASAIIAGLRARGAALRTNAVMPIGTPDYPTKAKRPTNSRLDLDRLRRIFGVTTPPWNDALDPELDELVRVHYPVA
jgi:dTDP-4-dehydrorhamnose reductase